MLKRYALTTAALLGLVAAASAQTPKVGPNGGEVVIADGHAVEFVPADKELVFYVLEEDGSPMDTKGATGRATIQEGKARTVTLSGAPPNRFVGALAQPIAPGTRVVFTARAHGHGLQARFVRK